MIEEGCPDACGLQSLRQDVSHASARLQGFHRLSADIQMGEIVGNSGQIDQLTGKENVNVVLDGQLFSDSCQLVLFFTV